LYAIRKLSNKIWYYGYENIISNVCAALVGGSEFVDGSNSGDHYAIFEQRTRNTEIGIKGKNIENPLAILFAASNILKYFGFEQIINII
jgi:isocitrate dehydrogenase (NAD+)